MINIAVVCREIDTTILNYLKREFEGDKINVVSPVFKKYRENNGIVEIPDDYILNKEELKKQIKVDRFNWYYQQFLKYKLILFFENEETLIIDGDTIMKKSIVDSDTLLYTNWKMFQGYLNFNNRLIPDLYDKREKIVSFITNQMFFKKKYVKEIINLIEKETDTNWINGIVKLIQETEEHRMFSEYQLYADYFIQQANPSLKQIKVYRRMDLINTSVDKALKKYPIIAYEHKHVTDYIRKLRAYVYYYLGLNFG